MEIELPDGTVLDAPDGADVKKVVQGYQLQQRLVRNRESAEQPYNPVIQDDAFVEGTGSGMVRATRGLGSLLNKTVNMHPLAKAIGGVNLPNSEFYSDEAIQQQDQMDSPLAQTRAGSLGQLAGQTAVAAAATAPIGGIGGAAPGANVLTRTLASAPAKAGLEGAVSGAALADPTAQGEGAAKGAGLSATIQALFGAGGRVVSGLVKKSQAAQELEHLAGQHGEDLFVPLSQAADETDTISRLGKQIYSEALPIIPGVKYRLNRQGTQAAEKLREISIKEGTPEGVNLPANPGRNVEEAVRTVQKGFDDAYDQTIKSYSFQVPQTFRSDVVKAMRSSVDPKTTLNRQTLGALSTKVDDLMQKFSDGKGVIDGQNLMNLRQEVSAMLKKAKEYEKAPLKSAVAHIDDMVKTQLQQGGKKSNIADLQRYLDLEPSQNAFKPVKAAADATPETEGRFLFKTLARVSDENATQRGIGQLGAQTLDKPAATGTLTGRILANLGLAGAGVGAFMAPATTLAAMAGGQALTSKMAQKALMGDLKSQRAIAAFIQRNPDQVEQVERILRQVSVSAASGDSDGHD